MAWAKRGFLGISAAVPDEAGSVENEWVQEAHQRCNGGREGSPSDEGRDLLHPRALPLVSPRVSVQLGFFDSPRADALMFAILLVPSSTMHTSPARGSGMGPSRTSSSFAKMELRLTFLAMMKNPRG